MFSGSRTSMLSSMKSMLTLWCTLILCIAFLCGVSHAILDDPEKDALAELFSAFPNLGSIPTSELVEDGFIDYGRSWTNNFDSLCLNGDGYDYYGLFCSQGHISGIVLTQAWEPGISSNFSSVVGLTFLKNVTAAPSISSASMQNLVVTLANRLQLEYMSCDSVPTFLNGSFGYPSALRGLRGHLSNDFDLTPFGSLLTLDVTIANNMPPPHLGTWPNSLVSLRVTGPAIPLPALFDLVSNSTNLKSLTIINFPFLARNSTLVSESLESLAISVIPSQQYSLTFNSSSLTNAIFSTYYTPLVLNTPNIRQLTIDVSDSVPPGFNELYHLEQLMIANTNVSALGMINISFAVNLTNLWLERWKVEPSELSSILCQIVANHPKLSSLRVASVQASISSNPIFELPSCLSNAGQLRSLYLSSSGAGVFSTLSAESLLAALPTRLENLNLIFTLDNDTNIYNFTRFKSLKELQLHGDRFVGEMKNDFFSSFPNLERLTIRSKLVNGTIPSVGWANMRYLDLVCNVNQWTGLDNAPFLTQVQVTSTALETIPNDVYLENLLALEIFALASNPRVNIPTPSFWTRLPKLISFTVTSTNLSGPIRTSIAAPHLRWLYLAGSGVCGPLPDFDVPMTLYLLKLDNNRFSGTIPQSWATNLSIRSAILLSSNLLTGTIPSTFLNKMMPNFATVNLESNYFTGPVWDLSQNYPSSALMLSNNNFNVCDSFPLPSTQSIDTCTFLNVSSCPSDSSECSTSWSLICKFLRCQPQSEARVPVIEECIAPPAVTPSFVPVPTMQYQCPPPRPPGFECINGQWISNGSVTIPSISLPPNGGVILVNGNLSANGSLTFDGIGTSIVIEGCVEIAPSEVFVVIKGDEKLTPTNLISQKGANCSLDLGSIPVNLVQNKNNCKQVKLSTKESTRSSLVATFEINSHKCTTWIIILGSVLGGFVILMAVGITALYHLNPRFKSLITSCTLKKV